MQLVQTSLRVAPSVSEYLPGSQEVQAETPLWMLYAPTLQETHVATAVAPMVAEKVPGAHLEQAEVAIASA